MPGAEGKGWNSETYTGMRSIPPSPYNGRCEAEEEAPTFRYGFTLEQKPADLELADLWLALNRWQRKAVRISAAKDKEEGQKYLTDCSGSIFPTRKIALVKSEGIEITDAEAEACLAELSE